MVDRFIGCARTIALCLIHRQMGEPDTADKTLVCMIGGTGRGSILSVKAIDKSSHALTKTHSQAPSIMICPPHSSDAHTLDQRCD